MAARSTSTRRKSSGRKKTASRKKATTRKKSTSSRKKSATGRKKTSSGKKGASRRKYSPAASETVHEEMREFKRGTARTGPGGKGGKVKSRKQAIAIGLSEARAAGQKAPSKPARRGRKKKA